jgi:Flp pilus assembly protein TadG
MLPLVILIFGLVQYALYFWAMQGGSDVARSAARTASVGNPADCATFRAGIVSQIDKLSGSGATATVTRSYAQGTPGEVRVGDTVTVSVAFKSVDLHFPFIPFIHDGMVTSSAESRVDFVPSQPETCS